MGRSNTTETLNLFATLTGLTIFLLQLWIFITPVSGESLYFAQSEWRVAVPINFPVESSSATRILLARIVVVRGALETENDTWHFEIQSATPSNPGIEVSPNSGKVYLRAPLRNLTAGLSVTLTVAAKSTPHSRPAQTQVHVDFISVSTNLATWCASKEACLLPSGGDFRLSENDPRQLIGCLGFLGYRSLCPNNAVRYWIQADNNTLSMDVETGEVWTQQPFDRELAQKVTFNYGCNITTPGNVTSFSREGTLTVNDVNDNGPELKNGHEYEIYLDSDVPVNEHLRFPYPIILKDKDSIRSNYSVDIMGDVGNFLRAEISEINFNQGHSKPSKEVFLKAELIVNKTLAFPGESYRISLIFKDVTLLPGNGDNQAVVNIIIHNKTTTSTVSQQYDVNVFSNATKYAQVLGPFHKHLGKATEIKFSLDPDSKEAREVFNVTATQGIIYVLDPLRLKALSPGPLGLRLSWSFPASPSLNNATWINVTIIPEPDTAVENITTTCANIVQALRHQIEGLKEEVKLHNALRLQIKGLQQENEWLTKNTEMKRKLEETNKENAELKKKIKLQEQQLKEKDQTIRRLTATNSRRGTTRSIISRGSC